VSILEDFISLIDSDEKKVNIVDLFEDNEERLRWEKMVEIFEEIQIDNVTSGLKSVAEKYKLNRQEEINILAYVKFLELMIARMHMMKEMDDTNGGGFDGDLSSTNSSSDGMYG
tara:strand:+ start:343 stop:684 length:342 start_codon:yes stop_codon:yes gene_type:complete